MKFSAVLFAAGALASVIPEVSEPVESGSAVVTTDAPEATDAVTEDSKWTTSTVYETNVITITDCEDTVTDCPGDATKVITETIAVSTTVCPVEETETPEEPEEPETPEETETPEEPEETDDSSPRSPSLPYTTVIPTVIVETYVEDCPAPTGLPPPPPVAFPEAALAPTARNSGPKPSSPVTAGAASMAGSIFFAAAAGIAAYAFA
ncbi:unnamed protein product [Parascedosporium putredinis]|uniref:Uncharacterized protein n=1 Tax=Parascedosporium putredinis TaxID=1442378 RepID=A0A9P1H6X5_9PEZI|nr:unnamed protein product [Parascedosporium putredinis]CAI8000738.1 unnamed protein product [Parascedosporium putredinis]